MLLLVAPSSVVDREETWFEGEINTSQISQRRAKSQSQNSTMKQSRELARY